MKNNDRRRKNIRARRDRSVALLAMAMSLALALTVCGIGAIMDRNSVHVANAEGATESLPYPTIDTSPALYVAEKTANSVVGIITNTQAWDRNYGVQDQKLGEGSGVVIKEGGYVLTNYHVIESGNDFQVLMPSGDKVDATLIGSDSALDLAVLKVEDKADELTPVSIGDSEALKVGATVVAIGNPGGEVLARTVTQGIVSALDRSSISGRNTTRNVDYIQHDASISSGNSGGGLFDFQANLIGINTLKYAGSSYAGSYEGLGFAIPVEVAWPVAQQLIEYGKVQRPQMGIVVKDVEGPDEAMDDYPPASVCVYTVNEGSPAEKAELKQYDFITAVDGERVTTTRELTTLLDKYQPGDTVTVTVVRYNNAGLVQNNYNNYNNYYNNWPFNFGFGNFGGSYGYDYGNGNGNGNGNSGSADATTGTLVVGGGFETVDIDVTLEVIED